MDGIQPVGEAIRPPDPLGGLKAYSGILGLKQQQLALQTGQAGLQTAQSQATVAKQTAKENQNLAQLLQDPVGNGIVDAQGNPTSSAEQIVLKAAPTTGADHYSAIVNAAQKKLQFNTSVNNLRTTERAEIGNTIGGAAADPNATASSIGAQIDGLVESKKDTPVYQDYLTIANSAKQLLNHSEQTQQQTGQIVPPEQSMVRNNGLTLARTLLGAAGTVGAGGIGNPQGITNAAQQNINRNPVTGAETAPQLGAGVTNPSAPQVAAKTQALTGVATTDVGRMQQVSGMIPQATSTIALSEHVDDLANQISSGKFSAAIMHAAAAAGVNDPAVVARQLLQKDLGQIQSQASAGAQSDQKLATILSGFPEATSATNTIHGAMDYVRGWARQTLARGQQLNAYSQTHPDLAGYQHADDAITSTTDPFMFEFKSLKTPEQQQAFYRRNFSDPQEAQAFKNRVKAMSHMNVLGQ